MTEVGEIPVEWEIKMLGEVASLITKGTTPSTYGFDFVGDGINFIKIENIGTNGVLDKKSFLKISYECNEKLSRSKIEENDILISIAGTLGKSTIVTKDILPANTNQALAIIRITNAMYNVKYVNVFLRSFYLEKYINRISTVGAQPNLSLQQISNIKIAIPTYDEQEKIGNIIISVDTQIEEYENKKSKLEELKKGLMQQLLTGKVRVRY